MSINVDTGASTGGRNAVNPIGDLYALQAQLALQYSQKYPGDESMSADECWQDERFGVCRLNDAEYIIFDHETNEEAMLEAKYLQCSEFKLGAWYAWRRMEALGLGPDAFPHDERFDVELGDALVDGACILLGREARDPSPFEVEESGCGILTIWDSILDIEVRLVKSELLNE
jgi:hypothetical protein